jgi:hypothetical protein
MCCGAGVDVGCQLEYDRLYLMLFGEIFAFFDVVFLA